MLLSAPLRRSPPGLFSKLRFFLIPSFLSKPRTVLSLPSACVCGINKLGIHSPPPTNLKWRPDLHPEQPSAAFTGACEPGLQTQQGRLVSVWQQRRKRSKLEYINDSGVTIKMSN